jgi:hypothetical protein
VVYCLDNTLGSAIPIASLLAISRTFNSFFKVLFSFPSRYLFAIGLLSVFSLRWSLPPALDCNPKQPDSWPGADVLPAAQTGLSPSLAVDSTTVKATSRTCTSRLQTTTRCQIGTDYKFGLFPLHSQLLGESLLVSFPPLIDMLKFSG